MARKHYPQSVEELVAFASKRYPGLDWSQRSAYDYSAVSNARQCIVHDLSLNPATPNITSLIKSGHTDYALVVAASLEGRLFLVGDTIYYVDSSFWRVSTSSHCLHNLVRETLQKMFGYKPVRYSNGKVSFDRVASIPKKLKDHGFIVSVREEVKAFIASPSPPNLDDKRHLLGFKNGKVYDFEKNLIMNCDPSMLLSR